MGILPTVGIQPLFDNIAIDWDALTLPTADTPCRRDAADASRETPSISRVRREDLASAESLEDLYGQAVRRGYVNHSEATHLGFFATAAYSRRIGGDPPALFGYLIRSGRLPATLEDEDWAVRALKEVRRPDRSSHPFLVMLEAK